MKTFQCKCHNCSQILSVQKSAMSILRHVNGLRLVLVTAALLAVNAVAQQAGVTNIMDTAAGSTFGLWQTPMKIKGTPEELAKEKESYLRAKNGPAAPRKARTQPWDRRPVFKDPDVREFVGKVVEAAASSSSPEAFAAAVAEILGDDKDVPAQYSLLRAASLGIFHSVLERPDEIWKVKVLDGMVAALKWPEERVEYRVEFDPKAPRTAEGALLSGFFERGVVDDRFGPYRTYSTLTAQGETKILKSNPEPDLHAATPGRELKFKCVYDATGVHFYFLCRDPEAWRTKIGFANGAHFELTVMPGEEGEWYQTFFSAAVPEDTVNVEWDQPAPGHKLTRDCVRNDSFVGDDAYAFHSFFPWTMFHTRMPADGSVWRGVIVGGWGDGSRAYGGGKTHELGRGPRYVFSMPPEAARAVREGLVREAVGEYLKVRKDWAEVGFWEDVHLGDPDFFREAVLPLIERLDPPADRVVKGVATPEELEAYGRDFVADWSDFRLALGRLRAAWLEEGLFR